MPTEVQLTLDDALLAAVARLGPLDYVVDRALRRALDPARHRRWAEDHALLVEAAAGAEEAVGR